MTFDPTSVEVTCVTLPKDHCVQVPWEIHQCMWIQWINFAKFDQRSLTPRWPLTPHLLRSYVWLYPRIIVSKSHDNISKYVDTVTFFATLKLEKTESLTFDPTSVEVTCVTLIQGLLCPSPMKIHQSMWIQWFDTHFAKTWTKGHWPLDDLWPHICWGHVWLYPRIIVSKSHGNTSMYVDTVIDFANYQPKVIDP